MDVGELRGIFLFEGLDDSQLRQLLDAGEEFRFDEGDVLFVQGQPAACWWVLLEGRVALWRRSGHQEEVVGHMERPGVWAGGFEAWSEGVGYLTTGIGAEPGRMLRMPSPALGALARSWFPFGVHIVEGVFGTVRTIEARSRDREALVALGTLAAGLAHELNNPAAAASRTADALDESCRSLLGSLVMLAERSLTAEEFIAIEDLRRELLDRDLVTDPVELADREDALLAWLEDHDVPDPWRIAPALAQLDVDTDWCETAAGRLGPETVGPAVEWIAGTASTRALLHELKEATGRVSSLVAAVKTYSQLDRAAVQPLDVTEGIESTLTMLGHKLRDRIRVERDYADPLPLIEANGGELNQVWTNLIDNAIDAMEGGGTLRITTGAIDDAIVVAIADTGSGMPADVRARAFEPFFTTKDVGKGTGLGLDISRRIVVENHGGDIAIESGPAGTTLRVTLPRARS
ncbi:MAG: ATP-binding protein [Acidimicrobiia bacterium]